MSSWDRALITQNLGRWASPVCADYSHIVFCAHRFFFLKDLRSEMIIIHFGNEGSKISILLYLFLASARYALTHSISKLRSDCVVSQAPCPLLRV